MITTSIVILTTGALMLTTFKVVMVVSPVVNFT